MQGMTVLAFNASTRNAEEADLCESKASRVYIANSLLSVGAM